MPWKRSLYPANWDEIALAIKTAAKWKCQHCGKQCLKPYEVSDAHAKDTSSWAFFTLTVHHIDHNPGNNSTENLIALCAPCHLYRHARDKRYGKPNPAQLSLI
jgi:5-methylcytosine-specific restriction endonuclease McrA